MWVIRDTAGEVDSSQMLRRSDGVAENWAIGWNELDDVGWQAGLAQNLIHCIAGRHSRVTGLPEHHVTLTKHTPTSI